MTSDTWEVIKWAGFIVGMAVLAYVVISEALVRAWRIDRERQERERQNKGKRP